MADEMDWQPVLLAHPNLWCADRLKAHGPDTIKMASEHAGEIVYARPSANPKQVCDCMRLDIRMDDVHTILGVKESRYLALCQIQAY